MAKAAGKAGAGRGKNSGNLQDFYCNFKRPPLKWARHRKEQEMEIWIEESDPVELAAYQRAGLAQGNMHFIFAVAWGPRSNSQAYLEKLRQKWPGRKIELRPPQ